jgi:hypothetical protein
MNSRSDDHRTVEWIHVLRRVVSRLNSEFCIPLFWGFDSGLNNLRGRIHTKIQE